MITDGVGDGLGLALALGDIAADDALKLRELADHTGYKIGLGQPRRALDLVGQFLFRHPSGSGGPAYFKNSGIPAFAGMTVRGGDNACVDQPSRQLRYPLDLIGDRAE